MSASDQYKLAMAQIAATILAPWLMSSKTGFSEQQIELAFKTADELIKRTGYLPPGTVYG
jgi:hypothetical protein